MEKDGLQSLLSFSGNIEFFSAAGASEKGREERERKRRERYAYARRGAYVAINFNNTTIDKQEGKICKYFILAYFSALLPGANSRNQRG